MDKIYLSMEYVDHDMKVLLKQMDEKKKKFKMGSYILNLRPTYSIIMYIF